MTKTFSISETGDTTGEKWHGVFETKVRLSHRDVLRRDQRRRELLGGMAEGPAPDPEAAATALVFAELAVRLLKTPAWWDAADGGLELEDGNVVSKVYKAVMAAEKEDQDARTASAAKAVEEIRQAPDIKAAAGLPSSAALIP